MVRWVRRHILFSLLSLAVIASGLTFLLHSTPTLAATCGSVDTAIISGDLCDGLAQNDKEASSDSSKSPIVGVFMFVLNILTALVGIVAIGALVFAGVLYASASANAAQVTKAKEYIQNTVIGLVCYAIMMVGLSFLLPGGLVGPGGITLKNGIPAGGPISFIPVVTLGTSDGDSGDNSSDSSDITSTSPYSITLASWNTYKDNKSNKGSSVKTLMSTADVLGMQEVHKLSQRKDIQSAASSTIGIYYTGPLKGGGSSMLSYPIAYNKTKLTLVSGGYKRLGSTAGYSDRYVTYVRLRIKSTGQEFYFATTHMPPTVEGGGKPTSSKTVGSYKKQIPVLVSTMKNLEAKGVPVFLTGDFNVNFRKDDCQISWFPCKALRGADMKSSFELLKLAGISKSTGTHHGGSRLIDYVFIHNDSRVKANSLAIYGNNSGYRGSDHRPSLTRVTITAVKKSTSIDPSVTIPKSLKGVENFRDLAKYNSNLVKPGVVFRSAKLQNATSSDRSTLSGLLKNGVIIDLRTASKRAAEPDAPITGVPNLNYDVDTAASAAQYVKVFVNDATERKEFGAALTKIANTNGRVLFHCTKGKDRTGWLASMILYILGAKDSQVMTEYLHSRDAGSNFRIEKSWLNAALSAARKNNGGSIMNYIKSSKNGLGVSDATIAKLKAKLGK